MTSADGNPGDRPYAGRSEKTLAPAPKGVPVEGAANATVPKSNPSPREAGKIIAFHDLTGGKNVVLIELDNQYYQLSRTRSGKLVLTK